MQEGGLFGPVGLCIYVYHLNKYLELLDTFFLAFRKKNIIILHQYHHIVIILSTWVWLWGGHMSSSGWCAFINSVVHIFMYYYYLCCDLARPCKWKQSLTGYQVTTTIFSL